MRNFALAVASLVFVGCGTSSSGSPPASAPGTGGAGAIGGASGASAVTGGNGVGGNGVGGNGVGGNGNAGGGAGGNAGAAGGPSYADAVLAATWTKLAAGPTVGGGAKQDDVFFVTPMLGYAASGPNFSIFKTEDGGGTWTPSFKSPGTYFRSLLFLDAQHGFAGNLGAGLSASIKDKNVLYETKDGGGSWLPVTTITGDMPSGLCNFTAIDAQNLIGVGRANGPAHLMRSSDGGATWASTSLKAYLSMAIDARFATKDEGVVVGMGAGTPSVCTVIRTEDGGQSWSTVFASTTASSLCWKVHFPSANVGYVAVQDTTVGPGTFAKTIDGGKSWQELPLPPTGVGKGQYPAIGVGFVTDQIGWMAPESASLPTYRTTDGGQSWTVDPTLVGPINRFRFVDAKTAYAIGAAIWKLDIAWNGP